MDSAEHIREVVERHAGMVFRLAYARTRRREVAARFADSPVHLVGLGSTYEYHSPDPAELRRQIDGTKAAVRLAAAVGADGVKVRPNALPEGIPAERTLAQIGREPVGEDLDLGPIISGETKSGRIAVPGDLDIALFSGLAGDRVLLSLAEALLTRRDGMEGFSTEQRQLIQEAVKGDLEDWPQEEPTLEQEDAEPEPVVEEAEVVAESAQRRPSHLLIAGDDHLQVDIATVHFKLGAGWRSADWLLNQGIEVVAAQVNAAEL